MAKKDIKEMNYYELLEVSPHASTAEIKQAFRKIARIHHPDSNVEDDGVKLETGGRSKTRQFKILSFAYHTLMDPELRAEYDKTLPPGYLGWDSAGYRPAVRRNKTPAAGKTFGVFGNIDPLAEEDSDPINPPYGNITPAERFKNWLFNWLFPHR